MAYSGVIDMTLLVIQDCIINFIKTVALSASSHGHVNKCGNYYSHKVGYLVSYICSPFFHTTFFSYGMTLSVQSSKGRHSLLPVSLSAVGQLEALLSGCSMLRAGVAKYRVD
jgi:hypothetical protein